MRDRLSGIGLLESSFDLRHEQKAFHSVFNRRIIREPLNRLKNFLFRGHGSILARPDRRGKARSTQRHAKGWSIDGLGSVKNRGPSSVMTMQSSSRTPNSP